MATIMSLTTAIGKLPPWRVVAVCPSEPVPMDRHTNGRTIDCDDKLEHDLIGASEAKEQHLRISRGPDGGRSYQGLQRHGHGDGVHT
jgi:hypothetical protein